MKHYGDITKLSGYDLPPVDVITGGSPCQDLSVAGKKAGLDGERSSLFLEQIRIVKEMRERDISDGRPIEYVRPRWMVWENVPGAYSSAGKGMPKGSDFQRVLTETLMANSHPGNYCGQDAYNNMFVTENRNDLLHRQWTNKSDNERQGRCIELHARSASNFEGGRDHGYCSKKAYAN